MKGEELGVGERVLKIIKVLNVVSMQLCTNSSFIKLCFCLENLIFLQSSYYSSNKNMDSLDSFKNLFPCLDQREWKYLKKNSKPSLLNIYTGQQFTHEKVNIFSQHVQQIYKARAAFPLPHTPKIILSENETNTKQLNFLVQRGCSLFAIHLEQQSDRILVLEMLKQLLTVMSILSKRYGPFRVSKNMIKMTNLGFFIMWINQCEQSCHREFPLNSENVLWNCKTMIVDLLKVFVECKHEKIVSFLHQKINLQNMLSFDNTKYFIQEEMKKIKNLNKLPKPLPQQNAELSQSKSQIPTFLRKRKNSAHTTSTKIIPGWEIQNAQKQSEIYKTQKQVKKIINTNLSSTKLNDLQWRKTFQTIKQKEKVVESSGRVKSVKNLQKKKSMSQYDGSFFERREISKFLSTPQSPQVQIQDSVQSPNSLNEKYSERNSQKRIDFSEKNFTKKAQANISKFIGLESQLTLERSESQKIEGQKKEKNTLNSLEYSFEGNKKSELRESEIQKDLEFLLSSQDITKKLHEENYLSVLESEINSLLSR